MTLRDFLESLRRRWYVALVCVLLTPLLFLALTEHEPVWTGQARLIFLTPHSSTNVNSLQQPSPVSIAAVAVMRSTGTPLEVATSDSQATLYGRGVTDGRWTALEHAGNQWQASAPVPYVRVEATAPSPEEVERRIAEDVARVLAAVRELEDGLEVGPDLRVTVTQSPEAVTVVSVPGSPSRALLATGLLGFGGTVVSVVQVDRLLTARRRRGKDARNETTSTDAPA